MTRHAEVVEADHTVVALVLAARRDLAEQVGKLRALRYSGSDAREGVRRVVDDDRDRELVKVGRNCTHVCRHASVTPVAFKGNRSCRVSALTPVSPRPRSLVWGYVERTTGFEPATLTLARCRNPSIASTACDCVGRRRVSSPSHPSDPRIWHQ